jgi:hypothetical protein
MAPPLARGSNSKALAIAARRSSATNQLLVYRDIDTATATGVKIKPIAKVTMYGAKSAV